MEVSPRTETREAVERLQEWLQEGPDLFRRFVDHLGILQEQADDGEGGHWRRLAEAAREECEQMRREFLELRAENERLRKQQEDWDAMVASVNETTQRMNAMIARLRASRGKVL